ncbi:fluoride efflux transporter CrcB [Solibacillus sp. FSL R7-0668]|uniref:fluoride efflux transporter CrcB n=1 Tax=Solibacillus sp. FSL R7-0668 TaxID=2921688 RepID=UPI0030F5D59C
MMIAVAIGGFFGAILRFQLSQWMHSTLKKEKYIATLLINCIGSLLLGLFIKDAHSEFLSQLLAIGFLGAFTTFSTFSFEVVQLVEARKLKTALLYASSSCFFSIVFAAIGFLL